jgi:DNA-binding PadR family transcriptional regulator
MNDLLLLAMLLGGPIHGYALKQRAGWLTGQKNLHNNLVYPLLAKFRKAGWINQKTGKGQRGQTRELYSLTSKGKALLLSRLSEFTEKDAASETAFRLRVGLFFVLDFATRNRVLDARDVYLEKREQKFAYLASAMNLGEWGSEVTTFLLEQVRSERRWISRLKRKATSRRAGQRSSNAF